MLLEEVGRRLCSILRESDTVARLGGDEFAMLLPGSTMIGASLAARKVVDAIGQPFTIEGQVLDVGVSIGIALFPGHGADANALIQKADVAMYASKRTESGFAVYQSEQDPQCHQARSDQRSQTGD